MHATFPKKADGLSNLTHTWHTKNSSSGVLDFLALSFFSRSLQKFGVQKCTPLACKSTRQIKNPYLQQIHDGHLACASARQIFEPTMCFCRPLQKFWMQRCTPAGVQKCTPAGVQKCTPRASLRAWPARAPLLTILIPSPPHHSAPSNLSLYLILRPAPSHLRVALRIPVYATFV